MIRRTRLSLAMLLLLAVSAPRPSHSADSGSPSLSSTNGNWNPLAPITPRGEHDAVYDPVRRRLIVIAGSGETAYNDVWELNLDGPPQWRLIVPSGTPPTPRFGATTIYDPVRDRIIMFGGWGGSVNAEIWELTLSGTPAWNPIAALPGPVARYAHTAFYDPVRDRMVILGGHGNSGVHGDLWALSLSGSPAWTQLLPSGAGPTASHHSATYDPVRDRLIVVGGYTGSGVTSGTWVLQFSPTLAWSAIPGIPPGPHMQHTATYDPVGDRVVLFGGSPATSPALYPISEIWSLPLGSATPTWSSQSSSGIPPTSRQSAVSVYDPVTARILVIAGFASTYSLSDVWALDPSSMPAPSWSPIFTAGHPAWSGQVAVVDPLRDRIVVVTRQSYVYLYDGAAQVWSQVFPAGAGPPGSSYVDYCLVLDSLRDRLIMFGGASRTGVWALSLGPPMTWNLVSINSPTYTDQSAIYDPVRDRVLAFGGSSTTTYALSNDVWQLSLSGAPTWSLVTTAGGPPGVRRKAATVYDPVHDRMVVHGGDGPRRSTLAGDYFTLGDTWTLSLSAPVPLWTPHASSPAPSPRTGHSAVYDPARERMIVYGGLDYTFYYVYSAFTYGDAWALDLSGTPAWTSLAPGGRLPRARTSHSAAFDAVRDAMVVFGGQYTQNTLDYSWVYDPAYLSFSDVVTAVTVSLVSLEANPDGVRAEWHSAAGRTATVSRSSGGESWTLKASLVSVDDGRFVYEDRDVLPGRRYGYRIDIRGDDGTVASSESWVDVPSAAVLDLVGLTPNPSTGALSVAFTLPRSGTATIELLDTSGRRVLQRRAEFAAGRHLLRLAPAGAVAPGIYFVRLRQGAEQRTSRCTVLE